MPTDTGIPPPWLALLPLVMGPLATVLSVVVTVLVTMMEEGWPGNKGAMVATGVPENGK